MPHTEGDASRDRGDGVSGLTARGVPEDQVRARARDGAACAFPPVEQYGRELFGASAGVHTDELDTMRLVPPVFVPRHLVGRGDVDLTTVVGGFRSTAPVFLSALGSTRVAGLDLGLAAVRQAGALGIPVVIGAGTSTLELIRAYTATCPDGWGGVVVRQRAETADAGVWDLVRGDPAVRSLLDDGRLAFELEVGPGHSGTTALGADRAARIADAFDPLFGDRALRSGGSGTRAEEVLRERIRLLRNTFPFVRTWVKLTPARDVGSVVRVAWRAGADAVTVDGGTGWTPSGFPDHGGLPLAECLRRIREPEGCLLVTGRMWEGGRVAKSVALGARAVGLGRAALLAVDEDPEEGLVRLVECLALELRLLIGSVGKCAPWALDADDVWSRPSPEQILLPEQVVRS
ncbi:alpha-hydroxy-acid oxidizing protein [Umezawaea endophytica]|uniref:Alpha-hydroxy-acid oxidizing protein n=1 Tax=Umezawaea endophytica TaxID=1654476 RepID=A0A9X2VWY4_9PSEU|nr:alpha-hydroxy-acid oxidizing protein [Umezawaea endophytica]MCS7484174.1 alpha-hydroxy-acid oxidizing protein [Umezawaea endophytica]